MDWVAWHTGYETNPFLRRRLEVVQRHITAVLDSYEGSPLRVISMCAGEARDLLGALARHPRRDVCGCLIELDPGLAATARGAAETLGLRDLSVVVGDAGAAAVYRPFVPADLVLQCGVFGNISDEDMERTVRASTALCAPGATLIWTRHRYPPDRTVDIRRWLTELGFENVAFEPIDDPEHRGSVGVARYLGETQPLVDQQLFTFTRMDTASR
jgi:hypothetical protein